MNLEEFLINIEDWIKRLQDIHTNDENLKRILQNVLNGQNLFECINKSVSHSNKLAAHSLDSARELGYYIKHTRRIKQCMREQLTYPLVLTVASIAQAIAFYWFFSLPIWYTICAPIAFASCAIYVFEKTFRGLNSLFSMYWLKCFLSGQIDIATLEKNTDLSLNHIKSVEELAFHITGSSIFDVNLLQQQYKNNINQLLNQCKIYIQTSCQIMMVVIGAQMLYMLLNFQNYFLHLVT